MRKLRLRWGSRDSSGECFGVEWFGARPAPNPEGQDTEPDAICVPRRQGWTCSPLGTSGHLIFTWNWMREAVGPRSIQLSVCKPQSWQEEGKSQLWWQEVVLVVGWAARRRQRGSYAGVRRVETDSSWPETTGRKVSRMLSKPSFL